MSYGIRSAHNDFQIYRPIAQVWQVLYFEYHVDYGIVTVGDYHIQGAEAPVLRRRGCGGALLHFSEFLCISLHSAAFPSISLHSLHLSLVISISLHFSSFHYIPLLHFPAFLCISLHFSAFFFIYQHFSAFFIISLHFSSFLCILHSRF